jgi:hypothetical protein
MEDNAVMKTATEAMRNKTSVSASFIASSTSINRPIPQKGSTKQTHSTPLVGRVYHARMVGMNKCIQTAVDSCRQVFGVNEDGYQVLVLGCGHDSSYRNHGQRIFLVDFEDIVHARREEIQRKSDQVKFEFYIGADLRCPEEMFQKLLAETPFDPLLPTVSIINGAVKMLKLNYICCLFLYSVCLLFSSLCIDIFFNIFFILDCCF